MTAPTSPFADLDALISAIYRTISGACDAERDWSLQAELFHPDARQMRTGFDDGRPWLKAMTPDEYRKNAGELLHSRPFFEIEIGRTVQRFGNIAHVLSTYEAREDPDDPAVERRGVNSIQCYHDGQRWWIVNMIWDNERPGQHLPAAWLDGGQDCD
ncbi:MAG: hypothetical protein AAGE01_16870 [Pseudomonadota bacterium]